jgi:hypothetical protein
LFGAAFVLDSLAQTCLLIRSLSTSDAQISIEWLSLYDNNLWGSIPSNLGWINMNYLDLGRNQLTGTIPYDWVDEQNNATSMMQLSSIYLDRNKLNGTLPYNWYMLGDGKIELMMMNDNVLSGNIPWSRQYPNYNLTTLSMENNLFSRIDREYCKQQSIYEGNGGTLGILSADCDVCSCDTLCATSCNQ